MADDINVPLKSQNLPSVDFVNKTEPTVDMLDIANNKVVKIPLSQSIEAADSGQFAFKNDQRLPVIDSTGEVGNIPASQIKDAQAQGYQLQSPEDYIKYSADKIAGDQALKTFGENAASALTFGLSTAAQTKLLGTDPQAIAARDIANPISSTAGTVAGIAAPLVLTGGASAPAQGAELAGAGVRAAVKTGAAAEKFVAKQAVKLGMKNPVARAIAQKIAPKIAGSAVEGALFSGGQYIDETALGQVDNTAENFLATIGTGALVGGVAGGVLGGLEATVPSVNKAFKPIKDKFASYFDKEKSAAEYLGATSSRAAKLEEVRPGFFKNSVKDLNDVGLKLTDTTEEALQKIAAEKESIGKRIDEIYDLSPGTSARDVYERLANKAEQRAAALQVKGQVDPLFASEYNKLRALSDDYKALAMKSEADGTMLTSKELRSIRQRMDDEINFFKRQPDRPAMQQTMFDLRTELRDILVEGAERAKPELGKELKQLGQQFGRFNEYYDLLDSKLMKEKGLTFKDLITGGLPFAAFPTSPSTAGVLTGLVQFAGSDLRRKMVILGKLEAANLAVAKAINGATKAVFSPTKNLTVPLLTSLTDYDLARVDGKKPKNKVQAWQNIRDNLTEVASNPEKALSTANRRTLPIYNHAPETAGFIESKGAAGLNFLASKMPRRSSAAGALTLFKDNYIPSTMEMAKFERYLKAVERPLETLKELERGTLTREHVEALQAVYPNIYQQLQQSVINQIQEKPESLNYNRKIQLGILLNIPTDSSLLPQNILGLQSQFGPQQPNESPQSAPGQPVAAAKDFNFSERKQSATENVLNSDDNA